MSERARAVRQPRGATVAEEIDEVVRPASDVDLDALLDEIEAALEPNAEEFVRGYVQKGGE